MVGAGVVSFGLVGVFALPAYAAPTEVAGQPDGFSSAAGQVLTAASVADAPSIETATVTFDDSADRAAEEQRVAEEAAAAEAKQKEQLAAQQQVDLPAGAGAQGLINAALAQLGQTQDCTALVERSLRAVGFAVGDLGTSVGEYARYGAVVTSGAYAPGDILIWPGAHVAIYIGNGQAVHGGWNGSQTVIAGINTSMGGPSAAVRIG